MAEGEDGNLSYSAQQIDELLRCAVCLDRFKNPKVLPCQHCFCESPCLQGLVDRFHKVKCPECRIEHRVPYSGVSAFPTNRTLVNFLDLPPQALSSPQVLPGVNQQQQDIDDALGLANQIPFANQLTAEAPSRNGCVSCGRDRTLSRCSHCDNVICDTCKRSHIDQLKLDINRLVSQLRRGIPSISDAVSRIESKSEQLHQRAEAGKAEITDTLERYIGEIRNRQRLLHSEVQMWLLGEIRSLRMCQENVEVELASTASFCDSTEAMLARSNHTVPDKDLVDIRRQCVEHMENLRAYEEGNGVRLPRERQILIMFEGNRFSQFISNFGELAYADADSQNGSSGPASEETSRSSSSREPSPASHPADGPMTATPRTDTRTPITTDRALALIGSSLSSPQLAPRRNQTTGGGRSGAGTQPAAPSSRRPERAAALMGGGGSFQPPSSSPRRPERAPGLMGGGGGNFQPPSPSPRRPDRAPALMGGGEAAPQSESNSRQTERNPGLVRGGGGGPMGDTAAQTNTPLPASLSWELPMDFTYPRRGDIRVGNGSTPARRNLAEHRRRNLSDTRIAGVLGGGGIADSGEGPQATQGSSRNTARGQTQVTSSTASRNSRTVSQSNQTSARRTVSQSPGGSTNHDQSADPPALIRSRTYTRDDMQPIREEDTQSRASTADPVNRPRSPIRFDVVFNGDNTTTAADDVTTYRVGNVDGGQSVQVNVARNNYQDKGRAIIRFGMRGSDNCQFVWPRGIAISRSDQVYVADSSNHRVQVFDHIGTYLKAFGSYGQSDGEFDCLAGITINSMGEIIITDRYNHRIQVFDHQGNFKMTFGEEGQGDGQMLYPWGVACDSMGFIYVCDKENHRVQVFQSTGRFVRKFGQLGRAAGQFENPHYLAVSPDNKVYVSDSSNHRVQVFSIYGDFIFSFGLQGTMQGQMKYPKGIAIDDQGFVVVADSGNNRIQVFRGDGRFYCMFGGGYGTENGQFKGLEGLAVLGNGNVVISDRENHRVQIF